MIADEMMVNGRKDFLIVILKEQINMNKLPPELQTYLSKWLELLIKINLLYLNSGFLLELANKNACRPVADPGGAEGTMPPQPCRNMS